MEAKNVIIDCAQSFQVEHILHGNSEIISKIFPVPDGSSILTNLQLKLGSIEQNNSVKLDHLLDPVKKSAYEHFLKAEEEFSKLKIKKISKVTRVLMSNLDLNKIREIRGKNFNYFHKQFKAKNLLNFNSNNHSALNYPLLLNGINLSKKQLHERGIFVPTYWSKREGACVIMTLNKHWLQNCIFIPIDQRCTTKDIQIIASEINQMIGK